MAPPRPLAFLTLCLLLVAPLCSDDLDDPNAAVRAALQAELEDFSGPRWDERAAEPPGPALTDYRSRMARIAGSGGFLQGHRAGTLPLVRAGSLTEKLGVNVFLPQSPAPGSIAQGTLLFVHGYMSHSANFAYTFDFFTRRGWRVVTLDLPGHGLSTGTRADVDSFSEYGDAVRMWLDWVWSRDWPGPRILLAHSLGTSAALEALRRPGAPRPDKIVFGAPLLRPDWYPVLAVGEAALGWWLKRMPSTFGWDGYLDGYSMPLHWFQILDRWLEGLRTQAPLDLPLTIYSGDKDRVVDEGWNRTEYRRLVPGARYIELPGMGHLFFTETWSREDVHLQLAADLGLPVPDPILPPPPE